jgi:S1-C subfamily serine protease
VSWVDVVIALVVIVATDRGFAVGILRQVGSLIGFVSGFVLGVLVAPAIALHVHSNPTRPLLAALIVGVFVLVFAIIGRQLGAAANLALRRLKLGTADRIGGAAFAAGGSLVACWLVASLLVNVSLGSLSSAIATSRLLAVMDRVMPPVPSVEAKVQALFRSAEFPTVFAAVVAPSVPAVHRPATAVALAQADGAVGSVLKVTAINECGLDREGTGFVVAPGVVLTAAHVVAGEHHLLVGRLGARLIGFDPANDVAVLAVAGARERSLGLIARTPPVGTPAAVVGYPRDGPLRVARAAVAGTLVAQGRDIYDDRLVTRRLVVVDAAVEPGNSGSPLLVGGRVAGLIFSKSVADVNVAYAVPAVVLATDLARSHRGVTVSAGACLAD